jgi:hypothetical protein
VRKAKFLDKIRKTTKISSPNESFEPS